MCSHHTLHPLSLVAAHAMVSIEESSSHITMVHLGTWTREDPKQTNEIERIHPWSGACFVCCFAAAAIVSVAFLESSLFIATSSALNVQQEQPQGKQATIQKNDYCSTNIMSISFRDLVFANTNSESLPPEPQGIHEDDVNQTAANSDKKKNSSQKNNSNDTTRKRKRNNTSKSRKKTKSKTRQKTNGMRDNDDDSVAASRVSSSADHSGDDDDDDDLNPKEKSSQKNKSQEEEGVDIER
eukprot:scaffold1160_cov153-Amphora_coffeaeformis.AAC.5